MSGLTKRQLASRISYCPCWSWCPRREPQPPSVSGILGSTPKVQSALQQRWHTASLPLPPRCSRFPSQGEALPSGVSRFFFSNPRVHLGLLSWPCGDPHTRWAYPRWIWPWLNSAKDLTDWNVKQPLPALAFPLGCSWSSKHLFSERAMKIDEPSLWLTLQVMFSSMCRVASIATRRGRVCTLCSGDIKLTASRPHGLPGLFVVPHVHLFFSCNFQATTLWNELYKRWI